MKIKKILVTVCVLAITVVGLLASTVLRANAVSHHHLNFNTCTHYETKCSIVCYNDGTVFGSSSPGYTACCKRTTCRAYTLSNNSFISQDFRASGYLNNTSISTYSNGNLATNNETDKILNYGEIYRGGGKDSGYAQRVWVHRYRNYDVALAEGISQED